MRCAYIKSGGRAGGRGRGSGELAEIKALLKDLTKKVLNIEMGSDVAAVANQLINTRLRAVEVERKVREQDELLERIERLEEQSTERGGRQWEA